ncbi:hypothetical protein Nepgr_011427 [Nepenthes gracilis]|uniref:Cytochrome P450 n=1 Tax=Nepenthes gracilis TaxID=150966 RepID=A0AAD3XMD9_NEPGR|nr:hypothetical protein Nepgr_011427 [Nepenthes gracilis]
MGTEIESLWILALTSKCSALSSQNIPLLLLCLLLLAYLAVPAILCWGHPGGPAWGKYYNYLCRRRRNGEIFWERRIPGPRGYPVIGSMNLMSVGLAHRRLLAAAAAEEAGRGRRLMAFSMGETRVIITCNPDVAKEILYSSAFADRPVKESAYRLMFNRAIGFAPYGAYWRTLRRISATHMFSPKQVNDFGDRRVEIAAQMVAVIDGRDGEDFRVRDVLKVASLNYMMGLVFGGKYRIDSWKHDEETEELSRLVEEGYELLGKLNWADHLPWLACLDVQNVRFRCSKLVPRVNRFVNRIVEQHRASKAAGSKTNQDFVDVLLSLEGGPDKLSDADLVAVLWEMIFRGTDTVAILMEWVLARIMLHPDVQSTVHNELDKIVGRSRPLIESDIPSLAFLRAVIKEVLRLHPPGPLLSWARLSITDTTIDGYHVPAGTTAMVNMWAIARDPQVWADPVKFSPERFVAHEAELEFSVMGSDLRLAPFGSGRRSCPGKTLGLATVSHWLGTLLHEYEWLPSDKNQVDLSEVLRLSCEMASPLVAKVRRRRRFDK